MESVEITIVAQEDQVASPWLWHLCREFEVKVILKRAQVDYDYGRYLLQVEGSVEEIQRSTAWLMTTGMFVETNKRKLGA